MSENQAADRASVDVSPAAGQPPPAAASQSSWFKTLLRLWCLLKVDAPPSGSPVPPGVFLALLSLGAWVAIDWWQRQPEPAFYADGIALLAWYALGVLAASALLRWRSRPRPASSATVVLVLGLVPLPLMLVSVVASLDAIWFWGLAFLAALYVPIFLARGLHALTARPQRGAALSGLLFIAAFIWASDALNAIPDVWNPLDTTAEASDEALAKRETALFEQADRIDAALESIHRGKSPGAEAFFVGFAGVGDQKVFAQEIGLASRVLGERYAIGDRRLSLINDERDLERAPLASVSGLIYVLHGMAARMDVDRDVLFLAISSHGSSEPSVAVSNSQIPFRDLTDQDLAEALQESGIKWRVIVISACYAGGFIESLRDPRTIVITAAAADRTSFGCSNDSDLTYFGEAFYRDALPGARSLREAFDKAKEAIAARERAEGETPSNPQAYFGAEIEAKLAAMDGGPH